MVGQLRHAVRQGHQLRRIKPHAHNRLPVLVQLPSAPLVKARLLHWSLLQSFVAHESRRVFAADKQSSEKENQKRSTAAEKVKRVTIA
jgi:hypothetical protein